MSRSFFISVALCLGGSAALFGWMFSNEPLPPAAKVKSVIKPADPIGKTVFAAPRTKATPLNDEPVNIVINPGSQSVPVQSGPGDLVVVSSGLRMRSEPTSQSEILGNYVKGARFAHIRDENGWALVQSLDDGQKGWMFKKYMAKGG